MSNKLGANMTWAWQHDIDWIYNICHNTKPHVNIKISYLLLDLHQLPWHHVNAPDLCWKSHFADGSGTEHNGSKVNRSHGCPLRFQGVACTCGPSPWGAWAWMLPRFQCKTRELPISNFEMDVWLCRSQLIAGEWKQGQSVPLLPLRFQWVAFTCGPSP